MNVYVEKMNKDLLLNHGEEMYRWATELFPMNRSLTGQGTVMTLEYIKTLLPKMEVKSIKSGSNVFDWTVPNIW